MSCEGVDQPAWVTSRYPSDLWAVVRRATAPDGLVAVGVRGGNRQQRWGGFANPTDVEEIVPASQLAFHDAPWSRIAMPALTALSWLEGQLEKRELDWGPVGSVGFELATGQRVVTSTSDLDIALYAPTLISKDAARYLSNLMKAAPAKIDALVETPHCGFSLEEYAREESKKVLVRLPEGRQFTKDPWHPSLFEDKE